MGHCFGPCASQRGVGRVAAALHVSPSGPSEMLSGERNLDSGLVEGYMREFRDVTPALYWAARFLQDSHTRQQQALDALPGLVDQLNRLMAEARAA